MTGLAKFVSGVLHPLCMPLLTLGLLLATDGYLAHRLGLFAYLFVLLLINTLAPALSMFILKKRGVISDWAGQPLGFESDGTVLASASEALHEAALKALAG